MQRMTGVVGTDPTPVPRSLVFSAANLNFSLVYSFPALAVLSPASSPSTTLTSTQTEMPDTPVTLTPRAVPGAPPPPPVTKSQKKKRKGPKTKEESDAGSHIAVPDTTSAALIEKAPEDTEIKEGVVAPQLVAQPSEDAQSPATDVKPSPIVEMLNKRLRANGKKIVSPCLAGRCMLPSLLSCADAYRHCLALRGSRTYSNTLTPSHYTDADTELPE